MCLTQQHALVPRQVAATATKRQRVSSHLISKIHNADGHTCRPHRWQERERQASQHESRFPFGGDSSTKGSNWNIARGKNFCGRSCAFAVGSVCLPRPHFAYYFSCLIFLRGGWGCRPCLGRCSAATLHISRTVCCVPAAFGADSSAIRHKRTQLKLLCVSSPVRSALVHGCLGGTQNARSRPRAAAAVASSSLFRMAFVAIAACFDTAACAAYWVLS